MLSDFQAGRVSGPAIAHAMLARAGALAANQNLVFDVFLMKPTRRLNMKKILILSAATAALILFAASAPANAATRKAQAVTAGQTAQMELSARRRYRRHVYRYYAPRYRYHRYYYGRPYYYSYRYYYGPRYYRYYYPYGSYYYYGRPGFYFGFRF
jgi:hypothetical protein